MARLHSLPHAKQRLTAAPSELFLSIAPKPNGGGHGQGNRQKGRKIAQGVERRNSRLTLGFLKLFQSHGDDSYVELTLNRRPAVLVADEEADCRVFFIRNYPRYQHNKQGIVFSLT